MLQHRQVPPFPSTLRVTGPTGDPADLVAMSNHLFAVVKPLNVAFTVQYIAVLGDKATADVLEHFDGTTTGDGGAPPFGSLTVDIPVESHWQLVNGQWTEIETRLLAHRVTFDGQPIDAKL